MTFGPLRFCIAFVAVISATALSASAADKASTPRVEAQLISQVTSVPATGGTISLALHQTMQPEWHTYWRNPGESGEPTNLVWTLPSGFSASDIKWPQPERIPYGELANYGYSHQVLLRVEIVVPQGLTPGSTVTFKTDASWLVCKDICVPEQATLDLTLPVSQGPAEEATQWKEAFANARAAEPSPNGPFDGRFGIHENTVTLFFVPNGTSKERGAGAQFFPYTKGLIKASTVQVAEQRDDGFAIDVAAGWRLRDASRQSETKMIDGVLVLPAQNGQASRSFEVSLAKGTVPQATVSHAAASIPLVQAILFAVLGGLILNLMPCVFPILSMKALSLVQSSHAERPWVDGLVYLLGVTTTFAALAGALLWLRAMGEDVGWGFQLQSPLSVAALAYVLTLVALNLSGVFQIGSSLQGAGGELSQRSGLIGTFFTGVLAVVVAAPCTAPFMGAAMSFAFTQSAPVTIAVFLALGVGLALPWVLFSFSPALVRLLPRPGVWMERFKQFLAFPMYAAAAWLVWVFSQQVTPEGLFRVMLGLVLLAFAAWALGNFQNRAAEAKTGFLSAVLFICGLLAAIAMVALPFQGKQAEASAAPSESSSSFAEPFSAARLAALRTEGRPIFVNLTAAWCVSCLYNERVALSTPAVRDAFKATNTTYVVGDWTNKNAEISALLKQHARDGVPLYLYFPAGGAEPQILPQLLTESMILNTLRGNK